MNYEEALKYIHGADRFGVKCGLKNIRELLSRLGNPQEGFKSIHVAGTNGKGSTVSMLTYILMSQGYKVGTFVSPYLENFTERFQIDLQQIEREELTRITSIVKGHIDAMILEGYNHPTHFEIVTAIGFTYFAEQDVDYAVIETGLGGRLDATNILNPELSIITSISYDHISILGDTIEAIAFEKAGIIKPQTPVVMYPQTSEAAEVIMNVATKKGASLYNVADAKIDVVSSEFGTQVFNFAYGKYRLDGATIHLNGRHQILNASTVLTAVVALNEIGITISRKAAIDGLAASRWAGRLERLKTNPDIIIDGAHNEASAKVLLEAIEEYYSDKRLILLIGILDDKEVNKIIQILCPRADTVIITPPNSPRAIDPHILSKEIGIYCNKTMVVDGVKDALDRAIDLAQPDDLVVCSGSLYLAGEVRKILKS